MLIEDNIVWAINMYEEPKLNPSSNGVSVKSHEVGGEMTSDLSMRCFHYGLHDLSNQARPS